MRVPQKKIYTQKRAIRASSSVEYLLILTVIVIPIGMLLPMAVRSIKTYSDRSTFVIRLPFP